MMFLFFLSYLHASFLSDSLGWLSVAKLRFFLEWVSRRRFQYYFKKNSYLCKFYIFVFTNTFSLWLLSCLSNRPATTPPLLFSATTVSFPTSSPRKRCTSSMAASSPNWHHVPINRISSLLSIQLSLTLISLSPTSMPSPSPVALASWVLLWWASLLPKVLRRL